MLPVVGANDNTGNAEIKIINYTSITDERSWDDLGQGKTADCMMRVLQNKDEFSQGSLGPKPWDKFSKWSCR